MAFLFPLLFLFSSWAYASLQKINIKNLDLHYVYPQGSGTFEKLQLGIKSRFEPVPVFPVEISRGEASFDLSTPFVDFSWINPVKFVHDLAGFETKKLGLTLDKINHVVSAEGLKFTPEGMDEFSLEKVLLLCTGESTQERIEDRLIEDCLQSLTAKIEKVHVPVTLAAPELPDTVDEFNIPGSDFLLNIKKGDFDLGVRIKYYLSARVTAWGNFSLEENNKVAVIRVDRIKYGILPVTTLVLNQLRTRINNPNIEINPPYIRIKLGE